VSADPVLTHIDGNFLSIVALHTRRHQLPPSVALVLRCDGERECVRVRSGPGRAAEEGRAALSGLRHPLCGDSQAEVLLDGVCWSSVLGPPPCWA